MQSEVTEAVPQDACNHTSKTTLEETIPMRQRSHSSSKSAFKVDQKEAEKWFKDHGISITPRVRHRSEAAFTDSVISTELDTEKPAADAAAGELSGSSPNSLPHSMWDSFQSSSKAVTQAVQDHIIDKLTPKKEDRTAEVSQTQESDGLTPLLFSSVLNESTCQLSRQSSGRSVGARSLESECSIRTKSNERNYMKRHSVYTELWSWGAGDYGQLGHGDMLVRIQPCCITSLSDRHICQISAGQHHMLALTTDGLVYGWGDNSFKQISMNDSSSVPNPHVLKVMPTFPVIDIAAGAEHSLLQSADPTQPVSSVCLYGKSIDGNPFQSLEFLERLGHISCVGAGPNLLSSACLSQETSNCDKLVAQLKASEQHFYRLLLKVLQTIVEPILNSDCMISIEKSPFSDCLKSTFESLYILVDRIGLNAQELVHLRNRNDFYSVSLVGDHQTYMAAFDRYSIEFNNLLAMDGLTYVVGIAKPVLQQRSTDIETLWDRCQFTTCDDLTTKVSVLLQLALQRVREYHTLLEKIQLCDLKPAALLDKALTSIQNQRSKLTSQYDSAESTRMFWQKCSKNVAEALKEPSRRLIRESKTLPLSLSGASRLVNHWFVLFNDVFVHIQGATHRLYPLEKLWVESAPQGETTLKPDIRLIMPEASILLQAVNGAERAEWLLVFNQTITSWLATSRSTELDRRNTITVAPLTRIATHVFYKTGPMQGAVYRGQWRSGIIHGDGQLTWPDGRTYTGAFKDGKQNGFGSLTYKVNGIVEKKEGYWLGENLHGYAEIKFANGDSYVGFFKDNFRHGHGSFQSRQTGTVYVGGWREDKRSGYGVSDCAGEKYLGFWSNDNKSGAGVQVTLEGCYMEGTFTNNHLTGKGLIMTADNTFYEGQFNSGNYEINGKGLMWLSNGDTIKGTFEGSWIDGLKVSGVYQKNMDEIVGINHPESFSTMCVRHENKWTELFYHAMVALGCTRTKQADCGKAWEKVAVLFASLRSAKKLKTSLLRQKKSYPEQLETIPLHNCGHLTLNYLRSIKNYLLMACECELHPLGLLLKNLVDVYRTSYAGTGTHPRLLTHARDELLSLTHRFYSVTRVLFPDLPSDHQTKQVFAEDGTEEFLDSHSDVTDSEMISPTLFVFPMLLPRVYEPLFHLYALTNENLDDKYWKRIIRLNKQNDMALFCYLDVPEQFWFLVTDSQAESHSMDAKAISYGQAIEALQRMSTAMTPVEKLACIKRTFTEIIHGMAGGIDKDNEEVQRSMDDLFPVALFVVIRARLRYLSTELQFIEDLMDDHLEHGEVGHMFATLKACHLYIQNDTLK